MGDWTPERDAELVERMLRWGTFTGDSYEADLADLRAAWLAERKRADQVEAALRHERIIRSRTDVEALLARADQERVMRALCALPDWRASTWDPELVDLVCAVLGVPAEVSKGRTSALQTLMDERDEARAERDALLAEPSDEEVDRIREVALEAYGRAANDFPEQPPYRAEIRAILAHLRARAEVDRG